MKKIFSGFILIVLSFTLTALKAHGDFRESNYDIDQVDFFDEDLLDNDLYGKGGCGCQKPPKFQCPPKHEHKPEHKHKQEIDYIIVGLGTAGAVVARELSNDFKTKVLVLEAGTNLTDDPFVLAPNVFVDDIENTITFNPLYAETFAVPVFFPGQSVVYSMGRMWGGSSAHNYLLAVRGTPPIYNFWASFSGEKAWSYHRLLRLMKRLEHYTPDGTIPNPRQRGFNGPLFITQSPPVEGNTVADAISSATFTPFVSDYNDPREGFVGVSANQMYVTPLPDSQRSFSVSAFLPVGTIINSRGKGLHGRKLEILSSAHVDRIIFNEEGRAIGVEYFQFNDPSKVKRVFAKKEIILCAGSVISPAILERSGIGDPDILEFLGIPVLVDNPNVGANLINQYGPQALISASAGDAAISAFIDMFPFMPNDGTRRVQIAVANEGPVTGLLGFLLEPNSRGTTHIVSRDPFIQPFIDLNMFSDGPFFIVGTDAYLAVSFLKLVQDIAADAGGVVITPDPTVYAGGDSALFSYAQSPDGIVPEDHIVGTARMSSSSSTGVVNGKLQVFGPRDKPLNVRVVDNSISPQTEDGNTAYQAYLIGLQGSKFIREGDREREKERESM